MKEHIDKAVIETISRILLGHGFSKKGQIFEKRLTEECLGWCGLNITRQHLSAGIGINPVVGLIFDPVENVIQRLLQTKRRQSTLISSLGYLMPEKRYLEWIFPLDESIDTTLEAEKLANAVLLYGEPFSRQHASLGAVMESLENLRFIDRDSAHYRLPIAYGLAGEHKRAREFMVTQLKEIEGRDDFAAQQKRQLFNALLGGAL
jgi:hypothetical protein